ncbi:MAG: hypothetical protein WC545_03505 [Patescibacteria group bacterium]
MGKDKTKKILDQNYADLLPEIVDYIVSHDEIAKALKLRRVLSKAVDININELKLQPKLLKFYEEIILKLKFACLPTLDEKEVISLIRDDFCFQFRLKNYDVLEKISGKILNIIAINDRNIFKENLKKAFLENIEIISANYEIKYVKDWIKNYVAKVGIDKPDNLAKAQYLSSLKNHRNISPEEYENLAVLFKFYDRLNIPSDSPEGFDEEPPIKMNGQLYIFRKGVLEPVKRAQNVLEAIKLLGDSKEINIIEKEFLDRDLRKADLSDKKSRPDILVTDEIDPQLKSIIKIGNNGVKKNIISKEISIQELEAVLKNYHSSSLEYKAIKEEISRLRKK